MIYFLFHLKNNFNSKTEGGFMNTKLDFETIDMLSKGITQFAFRSGPIEKMHAAPIKLSNSLFFLLKSSV